MNKFVANDPLTKKYTVAVCGNSESIQIFTLSATVVPKGSISGHKVLLEHKTSFTGHISAVTCVKYENSGFYLVSSSLDKTVKIWDNAGVCVATLQGHTRYVNCAGVSRDFTVLASGNSSLDF